MKNVFIAITLYTMFIAGISGTGCQSPAEKADNANEKVQEAKQDLKEAQKDAISAEQKAVNEEEWNAFKNEIAIKIKANETTIAEMKAKMKKSGKNLDAMYEKNIESLEQRNKDLNERLNAYEKGAKSDWASFKREFNHDMDELGMALKDLTVNNKK